MTVIQQNGFDLRQAMCGRDQDHRFGVIVSSRIRSDYLRLDTELGYDYPIVVLRDGAPYRVTDPLSTILTPTQLHPWYCAYGIPDGANVWAYHDPDMIIRAEDVLPEHRMPRHILTAVAHLL